MAAESIAKLTTAALTLLAAVGLCACDPVIDIAAANVPAWLVCALVGASIAALLRPLFIELRIHTYQWPAALGYSSLAALTTFAACAMFSKPTPSR